MGYDYDALTADVDGICRAYEFADCFSVGKSVMGRKLFCLTLGVGGKRLLLAGAFHGLEYLTAALLTRFAADFAAKYAGGARCFGYDARRLFDKVTLFILPMVNPDGVDIAVNGLDLAEPRHRRLADMAGIHSFRRVWQANARGVDLNHNYDARWSAVVDKPSPTLYGGSAPESEPETRAVVSLARETQFDMLLAFHSQGREIYYDFDGVCARRSRELAHKMAAQSGYAVCRPEGTAAFGGCKDWFIKEFAREGFTIEIGKGKNPLSIDMLDEVYEENAKMILCAMSEI